MDHDLQHLPASNAFQQKNTDFNPPEHPSPTTSTETAVVESWNFPGDNKPVISSDISPAAPVASSASQAFGGSIEAPPEPPESPSPASDFKATDQPMPVVKVLSVRGVEYLIMMLNLWVADSALLWIILALLNGGSGFSVLAVPVASMIVSVPLFALLFIRLKKAEVDNPTLRFDPSKRRTTQITQVFTFLVCLFNVIGLIYVILSKVGGGSGMSIGKAFANTLTVLVVVGGIFVYYWFDEHKLSK